PPTTAASPSRTLPIFDQGDAIPASAVFVDNLVLGQTAGGSCKTGAQAAGGQPSGTATGTVTLESQPFKGGPIPYGKRVDVTNGNLTIKTRAGTLSLSGRGVFSEFVLVKSSAGGKPLDVLKLVGGNFGVCQSGFRTMSA